MKKKFWSLIGLTVAVVIIGAFLWFAFSPVEETPMRNEASRIDNSRSQQVNLKSTKQRSLASNGRKSAQFRHHEAMKRSVAPDWYAKLSSANDRVLGKRIQDAQDMGDRAIVLEASKNALASKSVEVRQAAIDALSLQGAEAIPVLQRFLSDENPEVSTAAYNAWSDGVDGIDFEVTRAAAITAALPAIADDEKLDSTIEKFSMMEQSRAIRELVKLTRGRDGRVATSAKRAYETLTGESWVDWETAELKAISSEREK